MWRRISLCHWLFIDAVIRQRVKSPLKHRLEASFNEYALRSMCIVFPSRGSISHQQAVNIRLDVPTFDDPIVKAKLAQIHADGQAWKMFSGAVDVVSSAIGIASELYILSSLLHSEESGRFFVALAAVRPVLNIFNLDGQWPQGAIDFFFHRKNISFISIQYSMSTRQIRSTIE